VRSDRSDFGTFKATKVHLKRMISVTLCHFGGASMESGARRESRENLHNTLKITANKIQHNRRVFFEEMGDGAETLGGAVCRVLDYDLGLLPSIKRRAPNMVGKSLDLPDQLRTVSSTSQLSVAS
jgi:hypothetical protein